MRRHMHTQTALISTAKVPAPTNGRVHHSSWQSICWRDRHQKVLVRPKLPPPLCGCPRAPPKQKRSINKTEEDTVKTSIVQVCLVFVFFCLQIICIELNLSVDSLCGLLCSIANRCTAPPLYNCRTSSNISLCLRPECHRRTLPLHWRLFVFLFYRSTEPTATTTNRAAEVGRRLPSILQCRLSLLKLNSSESIEIERLTTKNIIIVWHQHNRADIDKHNKVCLFQSHCLAEHSSSL